MKQKISVARPVNDRLRFAMGWFSSISNCVSLYGKNVDYEQLKKSAEYFYAYAESNDERYLNACEDSIKSSLGL